jgi:hypothetical protein
MKRSNIFFGAVLFGAWAVSMAAKVLKDYPGKKSSNHIGSNAKRIN